MVDQFLGYNQNGMANLITNSTDAASATEAGAAPSPSAASKKTPAVARVAFFMESLDTTILPALIGPMSGHVPCRG